MILMQRLCKRVLCVLCACAFIDFNWLAIFIETTQKMASVIG